MKMEFKNYYGEIAMVKWYDSYGAHNGWEDAMASDWQPLVVTSYGKIIFLNTDIVVLAPNYAEETNHTIEQVNGVIVIPLCSVIDAQKLFTQKQIDYEKEQENIRACATKWKPTKSTRSEG